MALGIHHDYIVGAIGLTNTHTIIDSYLDQSVKQTASPTFANITDSGLTITRIPYASTAGLLIDSANLTFTTATSVLTTNTINLTENTALIQVDGTTLLANDGTENLFLGADTFDNDPGSYNIGLGYRAGYLNDTTGGGSNGTRNVFIGGGAGYGESGVNNTGYLNVFIGSSAGRDTRGATTCVAIGGNAMRRHQSGNESVALGSEAAAADISSARFISIGFGSLISGTTISDCTAIGRSSLSARDNTDCVGIGTSAGKYGTTGFRSIYIGSGAGAGVSGGTTGDSYNTVVGTFAFQDVAVDATYNSIFGYLSGADLTTGDRNIFLGALSGRYQTANSDLFIIDNQARGAAGAPTDSTLSILYGVMAATPAAQTLAINADTTISRDLRFTTSLDSAAVADEVSLGCYELSAGNRALAISQESAVAADTDETKFSHKLPVRINGSTYYIMLTAT